MKTITQREREEKLNALCTKYGTLSHFAEILGVTGHEADEIVQDTIAIAYEKIHQLSSIDKMDGWLFIILKRHLFAKTARERREMEWCCYDKNDMILENLPDDKYYDIYQELEEAINSKELMNLILQLKYPAPLILRLHFHEGYKLSEIAKMLKLKDSTVRSIQSRALKKLKKRIIELKT